MRWLILSAIFLACWYIALCAEDKQTDLYELLGISRDADSKEIRKAFKKLAVKLHPDKNKDDKDADAKFLQIARAYEILKDAETRKQYDLYGDTGDNQDRKPKYHSYSYYRDQFGIYDDDPLIVTLSRADYELNVIDSNQPWFINFYSPLCHHCHELAPTWRKLAAELEGVIRIAAVNCEEDWSLCRQLNIDSYPTLLYYEKEAHLYEGEVYRASRTLEALNDYVMSHVTTKVMEITTKNWEIDGLRKQQWLLFLCTDDSVVCPEEETRIKLAATLEGLIPAGIIRDEALSQKIYAKFKEDAVVFWQVDEKNVKTDDPFSSAEIHSISGSDTKEILDNVLSLLPDLRVLNEEGFGEARTQLRLGSETPWLICFYIGTATELNLQLKRLPALLPQMHLGMVHCGRSSGLCSSLHISHYPSWGVLKLGGAFELHHGRDILHEVVAFAKDSSKSTNLHALSPADFHSLVQEGSVWFIDWYAPWCPPCRKLMPEIRKASQHFTPENVKFGTIDCTLHRQLCSTEGVQSYPTTRLYNGSDIHHFHGVLTEQGIVEFVQDMLKPLVISLDSSSYAQLMRKPVGELWIVDYYAPWCGPCQQLAPQWRTLAKEVSDMDFVRVANVDCDANADLCAAQNIRSYPTIRLYPLESKGLNTVVMYNGHRDAVSLKRWLYGFLPSPVVSLRPEEFRKQILTKGYFLPWLIDFYTPWCGHCANFEPQYIKVARKLEGKVRTAKVDCEEHRSFCRELDVSSYPTVVLYLSPKVRHEISSQVPSEIIQQVTTLIQDRTEYVRDEL